MPAANYNIGIGHMFLKKDPIGDEITFAYVVPETAVFLHIVRTTRNCAFPLIMRA